MITAIAPALRHRSYRIYFAGQAVSLAGTWMQQIALGWMTYRIGGSAWALAWIAFATQAPILALGPWAGALSDRLDRRSLMLATQGLFMSQALILAALAFTGLAQMWHLGALALGMGVINAFDTPARQAFSTSLVGDKRDLPNAIALNSILVNLARILGPALAGATLAMTGEGACFLINALSYLAAIAALMALPASPPQPAQERVGARLMFQEGWRSAMSDPWIKGALMMAVALSFFGSPYATFLPMIAKDSYGGGPGLYGLMTAWGAIGALCGAFFLSLRKESVPLSRVLSLSAPLGGVSLMGFAFAQTKEQACVCLFFVSAGLLTTAVACNTLIQNRVEDRLRGRVMGLFSMALFGLAPLGSLAMSPLAQRFGPGVPVALGGAALVLAGFYLSARFNRLRQAAGGLDRQRETLDPEQD